MPMRLRAPFRLPIRVFTALASAGGAVAVLGVLALPAATGCVNSRTAAGSPETTLRAYAQALEEGRADAAYRMLSDEARRGISFEAFRAMVKDDPDGVREIGRALERPAAPAMVSATVTSPSGQELRLVLEDGAWRVDGSSIDLYAQDTPRHAVMGFVRAIERKRYDVVMRYVPEGHLDGLDAAKLRAAWEGNERSEIEQVVAALRQALASASVAIEETGERATMPYGSGTLQLVREHGLWKIENFD
ncbi:MAG TPA: hypothetical protein VK841_24775 [Polyangiaceae bacterium]|nr:hypothetical protein [Polyangiaceae bacterium]